MVTVAQPKALVLAGPGRSGSTLLSSILGQIDGWVNLGELMYLWRERTPGSTRRCGCGQLLTECEFWAAVESIAPEAVNLDEEASDLVMSSRASRRWPQLAAAARRESGPFARWSTAVGQIYAAAAEITGARVVVDSSKIPNAVLASTHQQEVETSLLQLVRDPLAVVASWRVAKQVEGRPDEGLFAMRPSRATYHWLSQSIVPDVLLSRSVGPGRYRRIRYEDFVGDPARTTLEIATWMGEVSPRLPFVSATEVDLGVHVSHSFAGNPDRTLGMHRDIAPVTPKLDRLTGTEQRVIRTIVAPAARRYGYR